MGHLLVNIMISNLVNDSIPKEHHIRGIIQWEVRNTGATNVNNRRRGALNFHHELYCESPKRKLYFHILFILMFICDDSNVSSVLVTLNYSPNDITLNCLQTVSKKHASETYPVTILKLIMKLYDYSVQLFLQANLAAQSHSHWTKRPALPRAAIMVIWCVHCRWESPLGPRTRLGKGAVRVRESSASPSAVPASMMCQPDSFSYHRLVGQTPVKCSIDNVGVSGV